MPTSADLIEAEAFCRRRLLDAFLGGASEDRHPVPVSPWSALITGCVLAGVLLLVELVWG